MSNVPVIARFVFRQAAKGTAIFTVFAVIENVVQAFGIVAAYPHAGERSKIIHDLASNPALGMFYGDSHANITTPAGYMVYRTLPMLGLVAGIWMLLTVTRLLRGQEDDGRWELLLSGVTTARRATRDTLLGITAGLSLSYLCISLLIGLIGRTPKLGLPFGEAFFYGLAIIASAVVFAAVAALASQIAATRRRALMYGAIVLVLLFLLRSVGNVVNSLVWLKNLTPFGWVDKLHAYAGTQPLWLLPIVAVAAVCASAALYLANQRDMGEGLVADRDTAKPHLRLLNSQIGFNWRTHWGSLMAWAAGAVFFGALMSGIAKTAAKSITDSGSLSHTIGKLAGAGATVHLEVAYISISGYFVATLLMIMVVNGVGSIRDEEGSGRLDNFLAGTERRVAWLMARIGLLTVAAVAICLLASLAVLVVGRQQGISLNASSLVFGGLNVLAPVFLLLGFDALIYGVKPRLGTMLMYAWIAWSFTLDIVASITHLSQIIIDTSLLHYIAFVPASNPNWRNFTIVSVLGLLFAAAGMLAFRRRDLQTE